MYAIKQLNVSLKLFCYIALRDDTIWFTFIFFLCVCVKDRDKVCK